MSKTIKITYNDKTYTLEYNRKSITKLEAIGFNVSEMTDKPVTLIPKLFYGAFFKNHPNMKQEDTDCIFEQIPDKTKFMEKLVEMYTEPVEALIGEPEKKGNVKWEVDW